MGAVVEEMRGESLSIAYLERVIREACLKFLGRGWEKGGGIFYSDSEQNFTPAAGVCQVTYDTGVRDNARLERADTPGYRPAEFQLWRDLEDDTVAIRPAARSGERRS